MTISSHYQHLFLCFISDYKEEEEEEEEEEEDEEEEVPMYLCFTVCSSLVRYV